MASPLIDALVQSRIIPITFPDAPSVLPPMSGSELSILDVLIECLKLFDKTLLREAASMSSKRSSGRVNGRTGVQVPRESAYYTELMRLLVNWLAKQGTFLVNGQVHLVTENPGPCDTHQYCDIVVGGLMEKPIILELVASETPQVVEEHITRVSSYKDILDAGNAWVVHFTCQDDYLKSPTWQAKEQLEEGINVVHIWHGLEFSGISMSAHWKDSEGKIQELDEQALEK